MLIAQKELKFKDDNYVASVYLDNNLDHIWIELDSGKEFYLSRYFPSTSNYVSCIKQTIIEYDKHLKNKEELANWDGEVIL